ncbi:MAG: class II aldolase/adducin family protein [Planctomycetes bacterium]|nr:class II aldolase/adducin family protein [Planctomycetota bacterium]
MPKETYCDLFRYVGEAALALHMENSHSGNISMMENLPGISEPALYITKTGSKLGHLRPRDICSPGLEKITYGVFQASSETNIHRGILKNARSAMHAHPLTATLLSFNNDSIKPIDKLGAYHLGEIPVARFEYPVGSQEMVEKIPPLLKKHKAMIVKTHGAFARGSSIKEVFYNLSLLEYSARVLFFAEILGVNAGKIQSRISAQLKKSYPGIPPDYTDRLDGHYETDDREILRQFEETCQDIFYLELSPFHTGSASVRDGKTMLYAPKASTPKGLPGPIFRIPLEQKASGRDAACGVSSTDKSLEIHRAIYANSRVNAVIHTLSSHAMAQAFQAIAQGSDRIIPADAEGGYLYPAIPVLDSNPRTDELVRQVVKYKMAAVKGEGIWSGGNTLGHTLHHPSSAKNICYFRNHLTMMHRMGMGPDVRALEDENGRSW